MSSDDIEPYDWYRRFFGRGGGGFFEDMFRNGTRDSYVNKRFINTATKYSK
ncbi:MAG: hypothetical protein WBL67_17460 [Nitrososphaeraceae archaeon]